MDLSDVYESESAWERSGLSNEEHLSERHIEMMTVLIEIRDELRSMNSKENDDEQRPCGEEA